ncbi:MAG TPA: NlpC/P60 family protein [Geopsychrobacteraceae bacterium]|nr:NlpC/P60 family protein [Geopsychrobacteraceae bacterium]
MNRTRLWQKLTHFSPPLISLQLIILISLSGCSTSQPSPQIIDNSDPIARFLEQKAIPAESSELKSMGFSVQVGAFSNIENAVRQEKHLVQKGIDAYHFRHESGLYKVRFGDYSTYASARRDAETLNKQDIIGHFFIIIPEDYAASRIHRTGQGDIREELVKTTRRFLGVPYRWGGTTEDGFDCSGLTMVSYRLNGLNLPRVSRNQFKKGRYVPKSKLLKGDLVFFATEGGKRVTHVGMYIGDGNFIHAPRTGKTVRVASLSNSFFRRTYVGGRTYL